ncbi:hypothetical protein RvY_04703-3 [Ramazzottius varieornatus]|uniref:Cadherin domain-containing protein n=1 Tax=Ramazzottius varieornatus TaxID=947166 RepID=A0A1D1USJ5_RAMVA|nr:hypothetical protein RvY_04703-3 [Ramazzottius varieornatus]
MSLQNAGLGLSSSRPYSVPYNNLPPGGTLNSIEFPSYSSPQNLQSYGGPYTSYRRSLRHTGKEEIESRRTKKYRQLSYASLNQMSASAVGTNFLIQKTSGPGVFRVDPNSGQITVMQPLDRERKDSYMLKVRSSIGNQYCVTKVGIEITDINDNTPIFSNQSYVFTAPCNSASAFVGAVTVKFSLTPNVFLVFRIMSPLAGKGL